VGRLEASANLSAFRSERDEARLLLAARPQDVEQRQEGLRLGHQALARFAVLDEPAWAQRPAVRRLPAEERQRLQQAVGELVLLVAGAGSSEDKATLLERAEDCFRERAAPRALCLQRAELARNRGDNEEGGLWRARALDCPVESATDHYLLARERLEAGKAIEAIKHLREAVRLEPKHLAAWYLLGNVAFDGPVGLSGTDEEAIRCYSICVALRPAFHGCWYNRGMVREGRGQHAEAEADFTAALALRSGFAEAHMHRGLVRERQGKLAEALADYTRAIDAGNVPSRTWFARAGLRRQFGDHKGAALDEQAWLVNPPRDEVSYLLRGSLRHTSDPQRALADYQGAVRVNPGSLPGRFNQALILADRLGQPREAIAVLDEVIRQHPHRVEPRASRGVLRARLGLRQAAHEDAAAARRLGGDSGQTLFQAACIHSLTSRSHPDDRNEAFRLLCRAVRLGFGHDMLEASPDLSPLRTDPRFEKLLAVVRAVKTW
jgi:tetratricopeptide (TPR) repeat protein